MPVNFFLRSVRVLPVRPFLNIDLLFVSRLFLSPV
jgi:hypothetical protein